MDLISKYAIMRDTVYGLRVLAPLLYLLFAAGCAGSAANFVAPAGGVVTPANNVIAPAMGVVTAGSVVTPAYEGPYDNFRRDIDAELKDPSLYRSRTGIKIVSLKTGDVFYSRDSHLLFHPASTLKLFTTSAALAQLGPGFRFRTVLYAVHTGSGGSSVSGSVYLKGYADPVLATGDLRALARDLKDSGVRAIKGDVVCDDTYLDDLPRGRGWMWDDASSCSYAEINALTVNGNCVTIGAKAGKRAADAVSLSVEPRTSYVELVNEGTTVSSVSSNGGGRDFIHDFSVVRKWREGSNRIVATGWLMADSDERTFHVEVAEPSLYACTIFKEALDSEGVKISGTIRRGQVPAGAKEVAAHVSPPLTEIVKAVNKRSVNLFAELILKAIGAQGDGVPGTAQKGIKRVKEFLAGLEVDVDNLEMVDGSGLSSYNLVSPDIFIELLGAVYAQPKIRDAFMASLSIAGTDGTMRDRLTDSSGKVKAKTGFFSGTCTVSGYAVTVDGEPVAFSIMMENFLGPPDGVKAVQDRVISRILSFKRGKTG
ncbi:MAG: D-alanyl-D-alanine carboxypeptidase/D-alanyl-D-alanine-endopeptidase [Nitrospirae bacterium]|nr:D-alanyl-D-alanine carboxypeptidase/D-alanyl-D-alanine-endopeptidase [Nitrospirota bacterium]